MRRSLSRGGGDRHGSGAPGEERRRSRERESLPRADAQSVAEQIAELNFKLTRIEQKLSNHASDLADYAHFKQQGTQDPER